MDPAERYRAMVAGMLQEGRSVQDLAERTGLHRSFIYRLRNGQIRNPSVDTFERLQRVQKVCAPLRQKPG